MFQGGTAPAHDHARSGRVLSNDCIECASRALRYSTLDATGARGGSCPVPLSTEVGWGAFIIFVVLDELSRFPGNCRRLHRFRLPFPRSTPRVRPLSRRAPAAGVWWASMSGAKERFARARAGSGPPADVPGTGNATKKVRLFRFPPPLSRALAQFWTPLTRVCPLHSRRMRLLKLQRARRARSPRLGSVGRTVSSTSSSGTRYRSRTKRNSSWRSRRRRTGGVATRRRRRSSPPTRNFSKTRSCSAPRTARRCETNSSSHSCTRNLRGSTPCSRSRRRRQKPRRTPPAPRRKPPREPPSARHRAFPARAGGHRPAQVAEAAQGRVRAKRPHKRAEAPELAGAPVAQGASATTRANPLGKIIRATQCKRCGGFGHDSGDRECPMRDHNPNDAFRAKLEDPLTLMRAREALREGSRRLELKAPMTAAGVTDARGSGPGRGQSADGVRSGRRRRCARGDGGRGGTGG